MTNREAIERAMAALEARQSFDTNKTGTKATPHKHPKAATLDQSDSDADAEAWNMLHHLSRIL